MAGEVKLPSDEVYVQYCASSLYLGHNVSFSSWVRNGIDYLPVNNPVNAGISPRRSTGNRSSVCFGKISLDIKVREERGVDIGTWGPATTEVHGVRTMKTHAEVLGRNMAGVLQGQYCETV